MLAAAESSANDPDQLALSIRRSIFRLRALACVVVWRSLETLR